MRNFARLLLVIGSILAFLVIAGCAESHAKPQMSITDRIECLGLTTKDKTYIVSTQRVMSLKHVKEWVSSLDMESKHPALGEHIDFPVFQNRRCFWSISLYESDKDKLQLWREYLVEIGGGQLFIANPDGGWNHVNSE